MTTIYGEDATIVRVLEKVELAARRALSKQYPHGIPKSSLLQEFSDQLAIVIKDICRDKSTD